MRVLGYGEDSLTLWALAQRLQVILTALGDRSRPADCEVLYRPSFGRAGVPNSSQFGEFDFILLTGEGTYLGESKWDNCGVLTVPDQILLRPEQRLRHDVFEFYVTAYAFGPFTDWDRFLLSEEARAVPGGKPIAPTGSVLQRHLESVLLRIRERFPLGCPVHNVLLYLMRMETYKPPQSPDGFALVPLVYGDALELESDLIPLTLQAGTEASPCAI